MRTLILYIASSLDGFIEGENQDLSWLFHDDGEDYGYTPFYKSIDTILMGHTTYKINLTFGGDYPFKDRTNYVFTRDPELKQDENAEFISGDIVQFVRELKEKPGKDIWLMGGGEINAILLEAGLIDTIINSIHPVILGRGTPLFGSNKKTYKFKTEHLKTFKTGLIQVTLST